MGGHTDTFPLSGLPAPRSVKRTPVPAMQEQIAHRINSRSETEQQVFGSAVPTIDLSEPQGLSLFRVLRGGIETIQCPLDKSVDNNLGRSSPSIRAVSWSVGRACSAGSGLENGYVVAFSFLGSNVSPFFQIVKATAAIFRARVSRIISGRIPFSLRLSRYSRQGSL